ncbi:Peptidase M20 [Streptococcus suis GZ1]|uniref:Peptidase M20 n=1 Tax=Streptococcus suis (strain GZ1) TaxID=423211 RepID=D5AJN9_STRGZ|nr:Peptidase M20 [Streptococcus suis GZ1]
MGKVIIGISGNEQEFPTKSGRVYVTVARELALVEEFALATSQYMTDIYGLTLPTLIEDRREFLKRLYFEPSITIQGLSTGYLGQGVKTIIPAQASAKMEVRLVPGLEPHDVLDKIRQHLDKHGFDKVEVVFTLGEMSYRSDMSPLPLSCD